MEDDLNLEAQVAHANAVIGNAKRIQELIAERESTRTALAEIEAELTGLLADGQAQLPLDTTTKRKCGKCGKEGHSARTCTATTGA